MMSIANWSDRGVWIQSPRSLANAEFARQPSGKALGVKELIEVVIDVLVLRIGIRAGKDLVLRFVYASNQLSMRRAGTRSNSRVFAVTSVRSAASVCAAINRSFGPMGVPCLAR